MTLIPSFKPQWLSETMAAAARVRKIAVGAPVKKKARQSGPSKECYLQRSDQAVLL
jgi:hypothetical protein